MESLSGKKTFRWMAELALAVGILMASILSNEGTFVFRRSVPVHKHYVYSQSATGSDATLQALEGWKRAVTKVCNGTKATSYDVFWGLEENSLDPLRLVSNLDKQSFSRHLNNDDPAFFARVIHVKATPTRLEFITEPFSPEKLTSSLPPPNAKQNHRFFIEETVPFDVREGIHIPELANIIQILNSDFCFWINAEMTKLFFEYSIGPKKTERWLIVDVNPVFNELSNAGEGRAALTLRTLRETPVVTCSGGQRQKKKDCFAALFTRFLLRLRHIADSVVRNQHAIVPSSFIQSEGVPEVTVDQSDSSITNTDALVELMRQVNHDCEVVFSSPNMKFAILKKVATHLTEEGQSKYTCTVQFFDNSQAQVAACVTTFTGENPTMLHACNTKEFVANINGVIINLRVDENKLHIRLTAENYSGRRMLTEAVDGALKRPPTTLWMNSAEKPSVSTTPSVLKSTCNSQAKSQKENVLIAPILGFQFVNGLIAFNMDSFFDMGKTSVSKCEYTYSQFSSIFRKPMNTLYLDRIVAPNEEPTRFFKHMEEAINKLTWDVIPLEITNPLNCFFWVGNKKKILYLRCPNLLGTGNVKNYVVQDAPAAFRKWTKNSQSEDFARCEKCGTEERVYSMVSLSAYIYSLFGEKKHFGRASSDFDFEEKRIQQLVGFLEKDNCEAKSKDVINFFGQRQERSFSYGYVKIQHLKKYRITFCEDSRKGSVCVSCGFSKYGFPKSLVGGTKRFRFVHRKPKLFFKKAKITSGLLSFGKTRWAYLLSIRHQETAEPTTVSAHVVPEETDLNSWSS